MPEFLTETQWQQRERENLLAVLETGQDLRGRVLGRLRTNPWYSNLMVDTTGRTWRELVARTEGILLDPMYSGKAMAGLIAGLLFFALGLGVFGAAWLAILYLSRADVEQISLDMPTLIGLLAVLARGELDRLDGLDAKRLDDRLHAMLTWCQAPAGAPCPCSLRLVPRHSSLITHYS